MTIPYRTDSRSAPSCPQRLRRKHVLMLVLALEVLWLGYRGAENFDPPGITVDLPATESHRIT